MSQAARECQRGSGSWAELSEDSQDVRRRGMLGALVSRHVSCERTLRQLASEC